MRNDVDNAPVVRFVHKVLGDAVRRGAKRIKFERRPKTDFKIATTVVGGLESTEFLDIPRTRGSDDRFHIEMEFDSGFEETAIPPIVLWEKVIRRLKVMARMVDFGPRKSDRGDIRVRVDGSDEVLYCVTTNPDPEIDSIVILERMN